MGLGVDGVGVEGFGADTANAAARDGLPSRRFLHLMEYFRTLLWSCSREKDAHHVPLRLKLCFRLEYLSLRPFMKTMARMRGSRMMPPDLRWEAY